MKFNCRDVLDKVWLGGHGMTSGIYWGKCDLWDVLSKIIDLSISELSVLTKESLNFSISPPLQPISLQQNLGNHKPLKWLDS